MLAAAPQGAVRIGDGLPMSKMTSRASSHPDGRVGRVGDAVVAGPVDRGQRVRNYAEFH